MGSPKKQDRGRLLREGRVGYLTVAEQDRVATFLERLARACESQVARVILFGSRARGDHEAESDIDLLVVTRDGKSAVKEITFELTRDEPYLSVPDAAQTDRLLANAERFVARMEQFLRERGAPDQEPIRKPGFDTGFAHSTDGFRIGSKTGLAWNGRV